MGASCPLARLSWHNSPAALARAIGVSTMGVLVMERAKRITSTVRSAIGGLLCLAAAYMLVFHVDIRANGVPLQYALAGVFVLAGAYSIRKRLWKGDKLRPL
jgi:hypothetical protein